jgi:hypothetical protein
VDEVVGVEGGEGGGGVEVFDCFGVATSMLSPLDLFFFFLRTLGEKHFDRLEYWS